MRYYSEEDLKIPLHYRRQVIEQADPIDITFCRDCDLFEPNYWQPDPETCLYGWCKGRSYYETLDDEEPYYIYTNTNSFCDKRTIAHE